MEKSLKVKETELMLRWSELFRKRRTAVYKSLTLIKTSKMFYKNLAAVTVKKPKTYWNKLTAIGHSVLELAKFQMFNFHYKVMKKHLDCELIFSDTDFLLYKVNHHDIYK